MADCLVSVTPKLSVTGAPNMAWRRAAGHGGHDGHGHVLSVLRICGAREPRSPASPDSSGLEGHVLETGRAGTSDLG